MKRTIIPLIAGMILCMAPYLGIAQVEIEFTSFEVTNITNQHSSQDIPLGVVLTGSPRDVYMEITATIRNTSDRPVNLVFSNKDMRVGHLYYSKTINDWVLQDRWPDDFKDIIRIAPNGTYQVFTRKRWPEYYFIEKSPLYYMSDIASNMRLYLLRPSGEVIVSGTAQKVIVNGVELNTDPVVCKHCADSYTLINNELMNEYIQEQPWLFPSGITDELIREEFACNMLYTRKLYSMMALPEIARR